MSSLPVVSLRTDRCEMQAGIVHPCTTLEEVLEESTHAKGVSKLPIYRLDVMPFELEKTVIMLRSGKHVKQGVVLHYCPFCGVDIGSHLMQKDAPAATGAE